MRLLRDDFELQEAIRAQLAGPAWEGRAAGRGAPEGGTARVPRADRTGSQGRRRGPGVADLEERRRKLLELYYREQISGEGFAEEESRLRHQIEAAKAEAANGERQRGDQAELAERFEAVARILRELDVDRLWAEATEAERRVLVEELVEGVAIFPDHLTVTVAGAPTLNVLLREVGLNEKVQNARVGGGI
jgi:hypothetical protein